MENSRKQLKINSILVLVLGAASLLQVIAELCFGEINRAQLPEGAPENILEITKIIILVVSLVILLPQFYVGFKGLRIAKKPTASRTHIKWAIVLFVCTIIGILNSVIEVINGNDIKDYISSLLNLALEGIVYYEYIKYARLVAKEME